MEGERPMSKRALIRTLFAVALVPAVLAVGAVVLGLAVALRGPSPQFTNGEQLRAREAMEQRWPARAEAPTTPAPALESELERISWRGTQAFEDRLWAKIPPDYSLQDITFLGYHCDGSTCMVGYESEPRISYILQTAVRSIFRQKPPPELWIWIVQGMRDAPEERYLFRAQQLTAAGPISSMRFCVALLPPGVEIDDPSHAQRDEQSEQWYFSPEFEARCEALAEGAL
jgi:hypothetical protein